MSILTGLHFMHLSPQQEPRKGLLYINICSWKRVPVRQDPSKPIPVCAGKLETETDEGQGKRKSCSVSQTPFGSRNALCVMRY